MKTVLLIEKAPQAGGKDAAKCSPHALQKPFPLKK